MRLATLLRLGLATLIPCFVGCAKGSHARTVQNVIPNPCESRKTGDVCLGQLPLTAPIVAGEGRIWALFPRDHGFVVREFAESAERVIAEGSCQSPMKPAVLGAVVHRPAILCVDFETGKYAYGQSEPSGEPFAIRFELEGTLAVSAGDRLREVSHFVPWGGKLAILYRTFASSSPQDGGAVATASLAQSGATASSVGTGKWWLHFASSPASVEPMCPRAGMAQCGASPITLYAAEGQLHVILPNGKSHGSFLHIAHQPGKDTQVLPVTDVQSTGKSLSNACVAGLSNGGVSVYTPTANLVSSLTSWQGDRMGLVEHKNALMPQGPDVFAATQTRCPPEVKSLGTFPNGSLGATQAQTQWLRATRANQTWVIGYGVKAFSVKQGEVTYSYPESYWILRRHGGS